MANNHESIGVEVTITMPLCTAMQENPLSIHTRLFSFMLLLMGVSSASAEVLSGQVADDDAAMENAHVILYLESGNVILEAKNTDTAGKYRFTVEPGVYHLCVSVSDYDYNCESGIKVEGEDVKADFKMVPTAIEENGKGGSSDDDCD